jgi:hypothetical protein
MKAMGLGILGVLGGSACFGEWVCLRSLELNRLAAGGTYAVWSTIVVLAGSLLTSLALRILYPV